MSVRVTIINNREIIQASAYEASPSVPFELELSNRVFGALWKTLGLRLGMDSGLVEGSIDGRTLRACVSRVGPEQVVVAAEDAQQRDLTGQEDHLGEHRADFYLFYLTTIALEAESREEPVCWS